MDPATAFDREDQGRVESKRRMGFMAFNVFKIIDDDGSGTLSP